jgi:hypothetical protein
VGVVVAAAVVGVAEAKPMNRNLPVLGVGVGFREPFLADLFGNRDSGSSADGGPGRLDQGDDDIPCLLLRAFHKTRSKRESWRSSDELARA